MTSRQSEPAGADTSERNGTADGAGNSEHRSALGASGVLDLGKGRIEALADGVFAVAMTLLVVSTKLPEMPPGMDYDALESQLIHSFADYAPRFVVCFLTFLVIGVYWNAHRIVMHYIVRTNHVFVWLNILLLFCISFLPFPAYTIGLYPLHRTPVIAYGCTLIVTGLCLYSLWQYAVGSNRLTDGSMKPRLIRLGRKIFLLPPTAYTIAVLFAFVNLRVSLVIYAMIPILYIFRGWIDHLIEWVLRRPEVESEIDP